jgi:hypothetical protein
MNAPIYMVGGAKGGVGKSMVIMAMLDYFMETGEKIYFIETDTSNPDTWKTYNEEVTSELVDLDEADGWIQLVNVCNEHPSNTVVINTAARNSDKVTQFGATLGGTLAELDRQLIVPWVINRQRDSIELLIKFRSAIPEAKIHVLRNNYFGPEAKFTLYNGSDTKKQIEAKELGGKSLNFPDLSDLVSDDLYNKRMSIAKAMKELPIGNRAELGRWRTLAHAVIKEVLA